MTSLSAHRQKGMGKAADMHLLGSCFFLDYTTSVCEMGGVGFGLIRKSQF